MRHILSRLARLLTLAAAIGAVPAHAEDVIRVSGIPDENPTELSRKYQPMVDMLQKQLGVKVVYVPVIDYGAAKGALANFSKALSEEVGARGIRVNTISPGPVSTDLWLGADGVAATLGRVNARTPDEIAAQAAADSVTGRFTTPQEVAALVLLLAGDRAGNVTGADFAIDGGLTTSL